ncbi:phage terminase small subunit P27 family [Brevundimonas pondensis]|uniref:Phage terminase small subunit P27 family n=1 Tax=Brevundimonas pondensis TaxID=2774189 RepID=A0ABX7SMD3_9CAUL|nr:phage terminase small subunit P27 family [Brevundimonas pondensis]
MRRGPKPAPAAVKQAKGNPGKRRIGADPVADIAAAGGVAPPEWLKGGGLKAWNRLAPNVARLKLLTPVDAEAFARYCRNLARWLKMQDELDREGETYESESAHGKLKRAHPAFLIGDRLARLLEAQESVFGLNPAERQRIFAARSMTPDPAGDLFGPRREEPAAAVERPQEPKGPVGLLN